MKKEAGNATHQARKRKGTGGETTGSSGIKKNKTDHGNKAGELKTLTNVNVEQFAQSRALEIQALTEVVKDVGGNHKAFQKLPRHMRRRAMSHNVKRVPSRLRDIVKSEVEKAKAPNKRPSRKYRRRPQNLLSEYERRKRRIGWLETHIWHAKRFKMCERWGYRLPLHPNDKSVRACYRAVGRHCLMQDVSFESYIEVKGQREDILAGLSHLTSDQAGLTFASKLCSEGTKQGSVVLYAYDAYPHKCIGQVTFIWCSFLTQEQTVDKESRNTSVLWISCHPSFFEVALKEITGCFPDPSETSGNNTEVTSLKDDIVSFRLFGPASNAVLSEVLRSATVVASKNVTKQLEIEPGNGDGEILNQSLASAGRSSTKFWWKEYFSSESNLSVHKQQTETMSTLFKSHSPATAPPNCVLALTVRDPRLQLPPKRNKVSVLNAGSGNNALNAEMFTSDLSKSPLWCAPVRNQVKTSKIPEQKLNHLRSQQMIPGKELDLGDSESRIPVVLVQRPGVGTSLNNVGKELTSGYSSGWDIILPSGWAMAFWVALVYRGARVGGLREAKSIALLSSHIVRPYDFPDSPAGQDVIKAEAEEKQQRHDRRPPAKRPNYVKLGFRHPFIFQFEQLVQEWYKKLFSDWDLVCRDLPAQVKSAMESKANKDSNFFVTRNRKVLRLLDQLMSSKKGSNKNIKKSVLKKGEAKRTNIYHQLSTTETGKRILESELCSLVPVSLQTLQRGVPAPFARVCLPSEDDLQQLKADKTFGGPRENLHKDPFASERRAERKEILRLRKKKKRGKGAKGKDPSLEITPTSTTTKSSSEENASLVVASSEEKLESLSTSSVSGKSKQLTTEDEKKEVSVVTHTDRLVLGFVRNGDFNFSHGQGCATAFVSMAALLHALHTQKECKHLLVLFRNVTSLQYRWATLNIIM